MEQHTIDICLAIKDAVTECIENMAFMTVDTDLDGKPDDVGADAMLAHIEVIEPKQGELRLAMPRQTAVEITKALFSITDSDITDNLLRDVACELLNTISGRIMKRVLPAECTYHLGLPSLAEDAAGDMAPPFVRCCFTADGNLLAVMANIEL